MTTLSPTNIDHLLASVKAHASLPLFMVPETSSGVPKAWTSISYQEYWNDVERVACHLTVQLHLHDVPQGSIVGLWVAGFTYDDYVYLAALGRAGYTPQLFSLSYTFPVIVFELLRKAGAAALVHDASFTSTLDGASVPVIPTTTLSDIVADTSSPFVELPENLFADENRIAYIYHTSGSTSGSPKLVPYSHKWLRAALSKVRVLWSEYRQAKGLHIAPIMGSLCHSAMFLYYIGLVDVGGCIVFPSSIRYSSEELCNMVEECGVNLVSRYAPLAAITLKNAQTNPSLLKSLRSLSAFGYGGSQIPGSLMDWAIENDLSLFSVYATTECGILMSSTIKGHASYLEVLPGVVHSFEPDNVNSLSENASADKLFEFTILPESPDIPDPSLVSPDGAFRTGDFFEPVKALTDMWIFRGRGDDWIKSDTTMKCDTRAIEEKVRETCGELVNDCVVVGNGQRCPAILVESVNSGLSDEQRKILQEEIIQRTSEFNTRRLIHERVTDPRLIYVLDDEKLPRTAAKGNIRYVLRKHIPATENGMHPYSSGRRRAAEEAFKDQLTTMYDSAT